MLEQNFKANNKIIIIINIIIFKPIFIEERKTICVLTYALSAFVFIIY